MKSNKCFQVRPKYIKKALDWLVINNDQYKDVAVINRPEEDFDVGKILATTEKDNSSPFNSSSINRSNKSSKLII